MQAHNHGIRAEPHRIFRKSSPESEMCAVRLVHNQRNSMFMDCRGNPRNIGDNPLICRGCDNHRRDIRLTFQHAGHLFRRNLPLKIISGNHRRNIYRRQLTEKNSVINSPVTVSRKKQFSALFNRGADRGQKTAGTSVDQIKTAVRSVKRRGPILCIF